MRRALALVLLLLGTRAVGALETGSFALVDEATKAENAGQVDRALTLYEQVLAQDASTPLARVAQARLAWLRERNAQSPEGLGQYLRIRALPDQGLDRARLEAFEALASSLPPGVLRRDCRAFISDAWSRRVPDSARAIASYQAWLAEPDITVAEKTLAITGLSQMQEQQGDWKQAFDTLRTGGLRDSPAYRQLQAKLIREVGRPLSFAFLALFVLVVLSSFSIGHWKEQLQALSPKNIFTGLYLTVIPALLAALLDPSSRPLFTRLGALLTTVVLLSSVAGRGMQAKGYSSTVLRLSAVSAVLACLAAGFLASEQSELFFSLMRWYGV